MAKSYRVKEIPGVVEFGKIDTIFEGDIFNVSRCENDVVFMVGPIGVSFTIPFSEKGYFDWDDVLEDLANLLATVKG